jgi:outer membrane protein TolC
VSAANRRYLGSGGISAESARYEDQRFAGVLSPATFATPPFARTVSRYGVSYSVPIDLFGVIAASREAAKSNMAAAELIERQETLMKLHAATEAYTRLQALQRQEAATRAQRQRVDATLERVRQEVQVQLAAGVDLKLAESEAARIASEEVRLRGMMEEARAGLREATGRDALPSQPPRPIPPWPADMAAEALPVQLARAQAEAIGAQAKEAHRSLLPAIAAVGDYSQFQGTSGIPDAWGIGARFTIPIDLSAHERASALDARARAAARRQAAAAGEFTRQMAGLKAAYDSALADLDAVEKEVAARSQVVEVQAELQRVGMTSMEDLLRQQRDLVDSESRRAEAQARAMQSWSALQVVRGASVQDYIAQLDSN